MPITIPIPDARWRSSVRTRLARGADWPELRRASTPLEVVDALRGRLGLTLLVCAPLVFTSGAGWLTAFLSVVVVVVGWSWLLWVGARFTAYLARRRYIARRAWRAGSVVDAALRARGMTL